ncbi:MAG: ABC-type spermidine/putrescine transport system, permease component II [halophilic archaeon J07HX5]|nr:MAG: ABC-type spermidine/putrescine transport system, permease component II [halophilic archaeon J07HX5]
MTVSFAARARSRFFQTTAVVTFLFLYLPVVTIVYLSFAPSSQPSIPLTEFSLEWYEAVFANTRFVRGLVTSTIIGAIAATVGTALGLIAARTIVRADLPGWVRGLVAVVVAVPLFVPTVVLALGIGITAGAVGIGYGFLPIVLGHLFWVLPFSTFLLTARYAELDDALEQAARDLGADDWTTFRTITLPLLGPALVASVLFTFALSFNEFLITFFLAGGGVTTMPLELFGKIRVSATSFLNAASVIVLLISAAVALVASLLRTPA